VFGLQMISQTVLRQEFNLLFVLFTVTIGLIVILQQSSSAPSLLITVKQLMHFFIFFKLKQSLKFEKMQLDLWDF
jgi:hypothetical protein